MASPFRVAAVEALGPPALAMAATFLAFGAAVREAGLPLSWAVTASLLIYGMAGQVVLLQALAGGVGPVAGVLSASLANARFLPMAMALAPLLGQARRGAVLAAVPFIAITPWAAAMRRLPAVAAEHRFGWFLGFGVACWACAGLATAAGHLVSAWLPGTVRAALLFANPLYFALLLAADLGRPAARLAVLCGAAAALPALWLPPAWALLAAGVGGGSAAFLLARR